MSEDTIPDARQPKPVRLRGVILVLGVAVLVALLAWTEGCPTHGDSPADLAGEPEDGSPTLSGARGGDHETREVSAGASVPDLDGLPESLSLRGIVLTETGVGVAGAVVEVSAVNAHAPLALANTDELGEFLIELERPDGAREQIELLVMARDKRTGHRSYPKCVTCEFSGGSLWLYLKLAATLELRARAVDANGQPVPRAVFLCRNTGPGFLTAAEMDSANPTHLEWTADAAGQVLIRTRPGRVELYARAPDGALGRPTERVEVLEGAPADFGDVQVGGRPVSITVLVTDASGQPVPGAWLGFDYPYSHLLGLARPPTDPTGSTLPDSDLYYGIGEDAYLRSDGRGRIAIESVSSHISNLVVAVGSPRHHVVEATLDAAVTEKRVTLNERLQRRIRLVSDGSPSQPVDFELELRVHDEPDSTSVRLGAAGQRMAEDIGASHVVRGEGLGHYMLFAESPGGYELVAMQSGFVLGSATITVAADSRAPAVHLSVPGGRPVSVRLEPDDPPPHADNAAKLGPLRLSGPKNSPVYELDPSSSKEPKDIWVPWAVQALQVSPLSRADLPAEPFKVSIDADDVLNISRDRLLSGSGSLVVELYRGDKRHRLAGARLRVTPVGGRRSARRLFRQIRVGSNGAARVVLPGGEYGVKVSAGLGWSEWSRTTIRAGRDSKLSFELP